MSPGVTVRSLASDEEFRAFLECDAIAFGDEVRDEHVPLARAFVEDGRTLGAFDGSALVGACANLTMEVTLPGPAVVPCAGVTYVSVLPSHRRRGVLTTMMASLLDDAEGHREPLAVLLASEGAIYGRFGFGPATHAATYEIDKRHAVLSHPPTIDGALRVVGREEAARLLPAVHDANRRSVPGNCRRSPGWWGWHLRDSEDDRDGASRMYHVVHERPDGVVDGYLTWRVEQHWTINPDSVAIVIDHSAATEAVRLALLHFACNLDLVSTIRLRWFPVDEPLRWALADPRRLLTTGAADLLWVRLLDVPRCLSARAYSASERLVIEVDDGFRPGAGGRFALDTRDGVWCGRTDDAPDVAMTTSDLGAIYLGGVSASTLAAAGRLRALTEGAVGRAARLFATDRPPYGDTDF